MKEQISPPLHTKLKPRSPPQGDRPSFINMQSLAYEMNVCECWEVSFLYHLIYLVCNNPLTWRAVFAFRGLGQWKLKILDSRFFLEIWDSIKQIVWNCLRLMRECLQFPLKHPIWFWHISVVQNWVKLNSNLITKYWFIFNLNQFKKWINSKKIWTGYSSFFQKCDFEA